MWWSKAAKGLVSFWNRRKSVGPWRVDEFGVAVNGDTGLDGAAVLKLSASTSGHCTERRRVGGKCA